MRGEISPKPWASSNARVQLSSPTGSLDPCLLLLEVGCLSLGLCTGGALQNCLINVKSPHQSRAAMGVDFPVQLITSEMVMCFDFQQTEVYQLNP